MLGWLEARFSAVSVIQHASRAFTAFCQDLPLSQASEGLGIRARLRASLGGLASWWAAHLELPEATEKVERNLLAGRSWSSWINSAMCSCRLVAITSFLPYFTFITSFTI